MSNIYRFLKQGRITQYSHGIIVCITLHNTSLFSGKMYDIRNLSSNLNNTLINDTIVKLTKIL